MNALADLVETGFLTEEEADPEWFNDAMERPLDLLDPTSRGVPAARLALIAASYVRAKDPATPNRHVVIIEGLTFARMAAIEGDDPDFERMVIMLRLAADIWGPTSEPELMGEAVAWLHHSAHFGGERAPILLNELAASVSKEAMNLAGDFGKKLSSAIGMVE